MKQFFLKVLAGILTIYLIVRLIPEVKLNIIPGKFHIFGFTLTKDWQILILIGTVLGLINFFVKPIIEKIVLPLKLLTFGILGLILNMLIIWGLDSLFPELEIDGVFTLFLVALIFSIVNFIFKLLS